MPDPICATDGETFARLFQQRSGPRGQGLLGTKMVTACPFCAAPDFQEWFIHRVQEDMQREATCKHCGRSGTTIITQENNVTSCQFVQTDGPPSPPWLTPPPPYRADLHQA